MRLRRYQAARYEDVLAEGRTHPLVLACRPTDDDGPPESKVVKALGLPEVVATRQLVAETVGNAVARQMGVLTPEPCVVHVDAMVARAVNLNLRALGYEHRIQPGAAAGCELIRPSPAPYTMGQNLTPEGRVQAARLYVFDLLSQNADRTRRPVNCGLTKSGLLAFDFEMCFMHLFLPILFGLSAPSWQPSKDFPVRKHLFYEVAKAYPPDREWTVEAVRRLTKEWWGELRGSLPPSWGSEADKIGATLLEIADHAEEFSKDVTRSLL